MLPKINSKKENMNMRTLLAVCMLILPLLIMGGCGSKKEIIPITKLIELRTPEYLSSPTPVPVWKGTTNQDLMEYVLELKEALNMCNADKVGEKEF